MDKNNDYQQRAKNLVNASVQDLQSSMSFYSGKEPYHSEIIRRAIAIVKRRKEITKVKVLETKLKKMQKEAGVKVSKKNVVKESTNDLLIELANDLRAQFQLVVNLTNKTPSASMNDATRAVQQTITLIIFELEKK